MFRSSGLEMLMTCKLLSNIELEIERQEGFLSTCTDLLMEMSAPKWIAEIVVSPLFSFPFLDSHCGVRTFLKGVLASTWNHVLVWDNVFCPVLLDDSCHLFSYLPIQVIFWCDGWDMRSSASRLSSFSSRDSLWNRWVVLAHPVQRAQPGKCGGILLGRLKCKSWSDLSTRIWQRHHGCGY